MKLNTGEEKSCLGPRSQTQIIYFVSLVRKRQRERDSKLDKQVGREKERERERKATFTAMFTQQIYETFFLV